jgi:cell division transport system permease protein
MTFLLRHLQVLFATLGALARAPLSTLFTALVLGIALALPAGLFVAVSNLAALSQGLSESGQLSLYLKHDVSDKNAQKLLGWLKARGEFSALEYVTPKQALAEFKRHSGLGETLEALDHNPLPGVIVLTLTDSTRDTAALEKIKHELAALKEVDSVELDLEWLRKLHALLALGERAVWLLAGFLSLAVLLVIGNTIRLQVAERREEILVIKLVGGTDAFIRRPFLYAGSLQGLAGGLVAWTLVNVALFALRGPLTELGALYATDFSISGLNYLQTFTLLGLGTLLGLLGSFLAVRGQIRSIDLT